MKSFGILRTNVGLTTNIKIMVGSDYSLSLDSIDSNDDLSIDKYKNVSFNKKNYYDELIPYFYKELPTEKAYQIKYGDDVDEMTDDFSYQYDELYNYGARNIINNKGYKEEFEYFAPLYITKKMPKRFIIFRVDGPGIDVSSQENFKSDILDKLKTVKIFDLTPDTPIGDWIDINFTNNEYFPKSPLDVDFRNLEFSTWNGIDYKTGGYTSKSFFIDDIIDEEKEIFELDKFVFNNFQNNDIVFPNILNFSFLFDDEPSTPDTKRKWSINRYYGFYLEDIELVTTISPYITPFLKNDVSILEGNILYSTTGDPFIEGWSTNRPYYVEYNGEYYIIDQFKESQGISIQEVEGPNGEILEEYQEVIATKYKIISDIDLEGKESELNQNTGIIDENNKLINYDITDFEIENFDDADVWLIEIDGVYHNITKDTDGSIKVYSDYSFKFNENDYEYKVAGELTKVSFIVDFNNPPKKFNIYKLKFSDIKDFDTKVIDTQYSRYEYEKENELTITDESKFYLENLYSNSNPKDLDDFKYNNNVVNIPVSSEYTAGYETFKIENNDLTDLWRINPIYCRWSYQGSLSSNDYPYLLNNSLLFDDFNKSVNPFEQDPKRIEKSLDYFYTINSSTSSYLHHSLHVEKLNNGYIDNTFSFELGKYLNSVTYSIGTNSSGTYSFDYFTYFFDNKQEFKNSEIKRNIKKYSEFNIGDNVIPNITIFKGIEFRLYDVESVILNSSDEIEKMNLKTSNKFEDYKFSILLSKNNVLDSTTNCFPFETYNTDELLHRIGKGIFREIELNPILNPPGEDDYVFEVIGGSEDVISVGDEISITATCSIFQGTFYVNDTLEIGESLFISLVDENNDLLIIDQTCSGTVCFTKTTPSNSLSWTIIDDWKMDTLYATNSVVIFDDILYQANDTVITESPAKFILSREVKTAPYNLTEWDFYNPTNNIFWSPTETYNQQIYDSNVSYVYNNKEYYYCVSTASGVEDFWNPDIATTTGYNLGDIVLYKGNYYMSMTSSNSYDPNYRRSFKVSSLNFNFRYWVATQSTNPKWEPIKLWNPSESYSENELVVHNDIIWEASGSEFVSPENEAGVKPGVDINKWTRKYSLEPDTDFVYTDTNNPIIDMNNRYYLCNSNEFGSTLNNGIIIYINKKWKNIFVNINISDNTFDNLSETDRDTLYDDLYRKLTAYNFILAINDITNKYGFTDYLKYVIIDENDNISEYSYKDNITNIPYLLKCEYPDDFAVKVNSLRKSPIPLSNELNPTMKLKDGKIINISQLNYYNDIPLAATIIENEFEPKVFENYNNNKNFVANKIYRFSGYYMPLFYDIQLFKKSNGFENTENYKFDTTLTDFGLAKERLIRKVNKRGSILKLKNNLDVKSIYPMLDEFGYTTTDFFIFKSTWDYEYHLQTLENKSFNPDIIQISLPTISTTIGQPPLSIQNQNPTL